jgi:hypothetical protein
LPDASSIGFTGTSFEKRDSNMLLHGVKDTGSEIVHALNIGAVYSSMISQMKPPLILPMDSLLMPRSRARLDVAQSHRFREFLQATRQRLTDALGVVVSFVVVRHGGHRGASII